MCILPHTCKTTHTHIHNTHICLYTCKTISIHSYTHIKMYTCMHRCIHMCIYVYIGVFMYRDSIVFSISETANTLIHVCPLRAQYWNLLRDLFGLYQFICLYLGTVRCFPTSQSERVIYQIFFVYKVSGIYIFINF